MKSCNCLMWKLKALCTKPLCSLCVCECVGGCGSGWDCVYASIFLILQLFFFSLLLWQLQALIITIRVPGRERGACWASWSSQVTALWMGSCVRCATLEVSLKEIIPLLFSLSLTSIIWELSRMLVPTLEVSSCLIRTERWRKGLICVYASVSDRARGEAVTRCNDGGWCIATGVPFC